MSPRASPSLEKPAVTYTAVVGGVIARLRGRRLTQDQLGDALGIGQSAYSRLESGETTMTIAQLRAIAGQLRTSPNRILQEADMLVERLRAQGVEIKNEKGISPGAILIGLGILAALLAAGK